MSKMAYKSTTTGLKIRLDMRKTRTRQKFLQRPRTEHGVPAHRPAHAGAQAQTRAALQQAGQKDRAKDAAEGWRQEGDQVMANPDILYTSCTVMRPGFYESAGITLGLCI